MYLRSFYCNGLKIRWSRTRNSISWTFLPANRLARKLGKTPSSSCVCMINFNTATSLPNSFHDIDQDSRQKLDVAKVRIRIPNCKLWLDLQQKNNGHLVSFWLFVTRLHFTLAGQPQTHLAPPMFLLRLCLWVILGMPPNSMAMFGPDCSSWGIPARSTSMRNYINSFGNMALSWVQNSNCMASRNLVGLFQFVQMHKSLICWLSPTSSGFDVSNLRTVLLCLIVLAKNCVFAVEQPNASLLSRWVRFDWMINHVCYAT